MPCSINSPWENSFRFVGISVVEASHRTWIFLKIFSREMIPLKLAWRDSWRKLKCHFLHVCIPCQGFKHPLPGLLWWTPNRYQPIPQCRGWWEKQNEGSIMGPSPTINFLQKIPLFLKDYEEKTKYRFWPFQRKNSLFFDYNRVFGHGENPVVDEKIQWWHL